MKKKVLQEEVVKISLDQSNEIYSPDSPGFSGTGTWVVTWLISVKDDDNR